VRFAINHYRRSDGALVGTFDKPINLRWRHQLGQEGPGTIAYGLAMSDPGVTRDAFAPKRTWYELVVISDAGEHPIQSGVVWSVNMRLSEDVVWVTGLDWLCGLLEPYIGFDYTNPIDDIVAALQAQYLRTDFSIDGGDTLQDVLDEVILYTPYPTSEQIMLTPVYTGAAFAEEVDYPLFRSDGMQKLDHLKALAAMSSPVGFDFWAEPDKTLQLQGPRAFTPSAVTPVYGFYDETTIIDGDWTNNGPEATNTIYLSGYSTTGRYYTPTEYTASITEYGRWTKWATADPAEADQFRSQADVARRADALATRVRYPQKELLLTVKPEAVDVNDPTAFFYNWVARPVDVDYDHPGGYHRIDAYFVITSQEFQPDESGDYNCILTLDQIYA
jgi:hypothetical protein